MLKSIIYFSFWLLDADGLTPMGLVVGVAGRMRDPRPPRAQRAEAVLLNRAVARRLLDVTAVDGCRAGVDWLILFRCRDGIAVAARLGVTVARVPLGGLKGVPSVLQYARHASIDALRTLCGW